MGRLEMVSLGGSPVSQNSRARRWISWAIVDALLAIFRRAVIYPKILLFAQRAFSSNFL